MTPEIPNEAPYVKPTSLWPAPVYLPPSRPKIGGPLLYGAIFGAAAVALLVLGALGGRWLERLSSAPEAALKAAPDERPAAPPAAPAVDAAAPAEKAAPPAGGAARPGSQEPRGAKPRPERAEARVERPILSSLVPAPAVAPAVAADVAGEAPPSPEEAAADGPEEARGAAEGPRGCTPDDPVCALIAGAARDTSLPERLSQSEVDAAAARVALEGCRALGRGPVRVAVTFDAAGEVTAAAGDGQSAAAALAGCVAGRLKSAARFPKSRSKTQTFWVDLTVP